MGFGKAITVCFEKYVTFSGRAARPEYWYFVLFTAVVDLVLSVFGSVALGLVASILQAVFALAVVLPSIAVGARRLHDIDRSGWWLLVGLVPLLGQLILIIWFVTPGTPGTNRFG